MNNKENKITTPEDESFRLLTDEELRQVVGGKDDSGKGSGDKGVVQFNSEFDGDGK